MGLDDPSCRVSFQTSRPRAAPAATSNHSSACTMRIIAWLMCCLATVHRWCRHCELSQKGSPERTPEAWTGSPLRLGDQRGDTANAADDQRWQKSILDLLTCVSYLIRNGFALIKWKNEFIIQDSPFCEAPRALWTPNLRRAFLEA